MKWAWGSIYEVWIYHHTCYVLFCFLQCVFKYILQFRIINCGATYRDYITCPPTGPTVILPFWKSILSNQQTLQFHPAAGLSLWIHAAAAQSCWRHSDISLIKMTRVRRFDQQDHGGGLVVIAKCKKFTILLREGVWWLTCRLQLFF